MVGGSKTGKYPVVAIHGKPSVPKIQVAPGMSRQWTVVVVTKKVLDQALLILKKQN